MSRSRSSEVWRMLRPASSKRAKKILSRGAKTCAKRGIDRWYRRSGGSAGHRQAFAERLQLVLIDRVGVLGPGKNAAPDLRGELGDGNDHLGAHVVVALGKAGRVAVVD